MNILSGKTAVVTGASGGLGSEISRTLAANGCNLYLVCRTEEKYKILFDEIRHFNVEIKKIICDFQKKESVNNLISNLKNKDIDILINAAGVFPIKSILESSIEDYEACFDVNVKVPFVLSRALGSQMCDKGWGRIVNIGSSSSYNGSPETGLYCASKHAMLGLSKSLFHEYKTKNVRVYSISPGSIQTPMGATDTRQDFSTFITPKEVSEYICFIISFDGEGISEEVRINRMVIR